MSAFPIDEGVGGAGTGRYAAGLLTLANDAMRGVEDIAWLTLRDDGPGESSASPRLPGFLDTLRSVLPPSAGLSMPARLAVSSVRAGLGVIEEGFAPECPQPLSVAIAFTDGTTIAARLPSDLLAAIRRDKEIVLGALARTARSPGAAQETVPAADGTTEALTSIFRYEKRNGRLRRVAEPEPAAKE